MKRIDRFSIIVAAAAAVVSTSVTAADPATGFYAGAGIGGSRFDQDFGAAVQNAYAGSPFAVTSAGMTDDNDVAALVYAGWQFNPYVAVEGAYAYLGKAKAAFELERNGPFTRDAEYEASAITLAVVGTFPLANDFTLLAKGGVAFTMLKYRETGDDRGTPHSFSASTLDQTRAMAGIGATYAFTPNWRIRAEWDRYFDVGNTFALTEDGNGKFESIDAVWVGVEYRFR